MWGPPPTVASLWLRNRVLFPPGHGPASRVFSRIRKSPTYEQVLFRERVRRVQFVPKLA